MTDDLPAFLAARLDEDEAAAKDEGIWFGPYPESIKEWEGWLVIQQERALSEVAAKRAILAEREAPGNSYGPEYYAGLWLAMLALAAIYSDHPDYRQEWAL